MLCGSHMGLIAYWGRHRRRQIKLSSYKESKQKYYRRQQRIWWPLRVRDCFYRQKGAISKEKGRKVWLLVGLIVSASFALLLVSIITLSISAAWFLSCLRHYLSCVPELLRCIVKMKGNNEMVMSNTTVSCHFPRTTSSWSCVRFPFLAYLPTWSAYHLLSLSFNPFHCVI